MPRMLSLWAPYGADPVSVSNSRVCLVLLRIFRTVPLNIDRHNFDDIVRPFWPVIRLERMALQKALAASRHLALHSKISRRRKSTLPFESDENSELPSWLTELLAVRRALPLDPPEPAALVLLGESLLCDRPSFRALFDAVEVRLERHVARHRLGRDANWMRLGDMLALDEAERRILALCADLEAGTIDRNLFSHVSRRTRRVQALRAGLLLPDEHLVDQAISTGGRLAHAGLMRERDSVDADLEDQLRLTRVGSQLLSMKFRTAEAMALHVLKPLSHAAAVPRLEWPHLHSRTQVVEALLRGALKNGQRGINLLFYGAPGTGKTEYVRSLVHTLGVPGFLVEDCDGERMPASRAERLGSLQLGGRFAPGNSVLVLDEAEDIFQTDYGNPLRRTLGGREDSKSWMNQVLETNRVPIIWISNQIGHIDPAYLRRFTYCMEFPVPPRAMRRQVAVTHLAPLGVSTGLIDRVASNAGLSPALVASAARVVRLSAAQGGKASEIAQLVLSDHMRAMGSVFASPIADGVLRFDARFLRAQGNIGSQQMIEGLRRAGKGTVLLSGAPGTGKTQLAGKIASELRREVVYRTAADINSMWYGESERNVGRMFSECDASAEVLFLDEAETLLGERGESQHRADRAVTAEFLRRLEAFEGVFVCATNHAVAFDSALSRRFMFRLTLLPLDLHQRHNLLAECLGFPAMQDGTDVLNFASGHQLARLQRLNLLTPGDFANVARRLKALALNPTIDCWLDELEDEHHAKPAVDRRVMGFV